MTRCLFMELNNLHENIISSIKRTIKKPRFGIAFSGGVDSTLISKICSDLGYDFTLLTVGFAQSHDVVFAKQVNESLQYAHHTLEINESEFPSVSAKVKQMIKTENLSWNENCIAFYYISKLAASLNLGLVITANGIDELFCGYNMYRAEFKKGESEINKLVESKLANELKMMEAVNLISSEFNVEILQPLLCPEFINHAKMIPLSKKIHGPDDLYRKHIIRELARQINVPEISCSKRKKALQYGTRIHKTLLKTR